MSKVTVSTLEEIPAFASWPGIQVRVNVEAGGNSFIYLYQIDTATGVTNRIEMRKDQARTLIEILERLLPGKT